MYGPPASPALAPSARRARGARALFGRGGLLLVIAALPVAFSAWIDPARLVAPRAAEAEIARVLASGRNVTDYANYDDRAIERTLVSLRPGRPEVLALGSSRLQPLRASAFAGRPFANGSMQAGMLDDMLAVYALYDSDERRPRRVVLNVDPWTPSADGGTGWGALAGERDAVMRRAGIPVSPVRDRLVLAKQIAERLIAPEYFRLAMYSLRAHGPSGIRWVATDGEQNREKTKLPDGSIVWTDVPADGALAIAARFASEGLFVSPLFERLGERPKGREDALERFVRYLRSEDVEVTLLLVPFPPEVYDAFALLPGTSPMSVESDVHALSARTGAEVVGSYDPRPYGITTRDFFDESHLRPEPLARLLSSAPSARSR